MIPGAKKYEYAVETVQDSRYGSTNVNALSARINARASDGWRLVSCFTNELGVNSQSFMGVGTNATIDETVLIFEREVQNDAEQKLLNAAERIREQALPICNSNIIDPIMPKQVLLKESPDGLRVSLKVSVSADFPLAHLKCDLLVRNVFGDEIKLENLCFLTFSKIQFSRLASEDRPIELPAHIRSCPACVDLHIHCYIADKQLVRLESNELISIDDARANLSDGFSQDTFMMHVETLKSGKDIYQFVLEQSETYPGIFTPDILAKLKSMTVLERTYGNCRDGSMKALTKFLETGEV